MKQLLPRSQTSDFTRLEGLQKLTSVSAYDWDLYILKELVDNALDADEADPSVNTPEIRVVMSYEMARRAGAQEDERGLTVEVSNRSQFPLEQVQNLFDLHQRYSVKDYYKYPTRGAQGNALKTILGIPYALSYRYFSNYQLDRVPLSISYGRERVAVKLDINELDQTASLQLERFTDNDGINATTVTVNIQRFTQEPPRTMARLIAFAEEIALFNPHATFHYEFAFTNSGGDEDYQVLQFSSNPDWNSKYDTRHKSPIHWYRQDKFRELVFALVRVNGQAVTLDQLSGEFGITHLPPHRHFEQQLALTTMIQHPHRLNELYHFLCEHGGQKKNVFLGEVGAKYLQSRVTLPAPGENCKTLFFYRQCQPHNTPAETPFMLEIALCANTEGKRRVITGMNHTPTYSDPFFNKPLEPPNAPEPVRSLEKLLDFYDLRETTPVILIVHLIAPNLEYESYGKNAISDKPYRAALTQLVDELVQEYREATRPPAPIDYLTAQAVECLPGIITDLEDTDFSRLQLLYALRRALLEMDDPDIRADLGTATANSRLDAVISQYEKAKPITGLHRRQSGRLAVPRHPTDSINVSFGSSNLLDLTREFHFRAVVITNNPQIEDILIASRYTIHYDLAVLRADDNLPSAIRLLAEKYQVILNNPTPEDDDLLPDIWIVRDATADAIQKTRLTIQDIFTSLNIQFDRIFDLGLHPQEAANYALIETTPEPPTLGTGYSGEEISFFADQHATARLESLAPQVLREWFKHQLAHYKLPAKAIPPLQMLTSRGMIELQRRFRGVIADLAFEAYALDEFQQQLIAWWQEDKPAWDQEIHQNLKQLLHHNPDEAWGAALEEAITRLLRNYLTAERRQQIKKMMSEHDGK